MIVELGSNMQISKLAILIYGPPGSGKTWFGLHMPKPYFLAYDKQGMLGAKYNKIPVDGVEIDTYDDFNAVIAQIQSGARAKDNETIVLDHLTLHGEAIKQSMLEKNRKQKADLAIWGEVADHLRVSMKTLIDLTKKFHVVVLAHEQIEKNEVRGGIFGTPATVGKFAYYVGGMFNLFMYSEQQMEWNNGKQTPKWVLHTSQYTDFRAKDGIGKLDVVEPNDPSTILGKIIS